MKLYLFGPMRGYPQANHPAFKEAREKLRDMGHDVFCPAELTETWAEMGQEYDMRTLLKMDLSYICDQAEGIVGLPGWQSSRGSLAEVHLAWAIGIPVYEYEFFSRRVIREVKYASFYGASKTTRQ